MTPLEAAQRLAIGPCPTYWDVEMVGTVGRLGPDQGTVLKCAHCRQKLHEHATECPVLVLPKIVAALEAAEHIVSGLDRVQEVAVKTDDLITLDALAMIRAPRAALTAALQGDA